MAVRYRSKISANENSISWNKQAKKHLVKDGSGVAYSENNNLENFGDLIYSGTERFRKLY